MREEGWYWVKYMNEWVVAYYYGDPFGWELTGRDGAWSDSEFKEIDERRIERGE